MPPTEIARVAVATATVPIATTVAVPVGKPPDGTRVGVATTVASIIGMVTVTVTVPLATAITGVVATTAVGVVVATACPDAPGAFPSPPTMVAMTSRAGTASLNQLRVGRAISSSFGTTLGERIDCEWGTPPSRPAGKARFFGTLCRSSYTTMELTCQILEKMFTDVLCGAWTLVPARVGSTPGWGYRRTSGHTNPIWVGALDGFYPIRTDDAGKGSVPTKANVTLAGEPVSATQGRAGAGRLSAARPERRVSLPKGRPPTLPPDPDHPRRSPPLPRP